MSIGNPLIPFSSVSTGDLKVEMIKKLKDEEIFEKATDEKTQLDFYKKMRLKVDKFIENHPKSKYLNYVIAAPDFFYLFCRLMGDTRIPMKQKITVGTVIVYFITPLDILPEGLFPGVGLADDVFLAVFTLNELMNSVDPKIIRELWPGDENVINLIKQLLDGADSVFGRRMIGKIVGLLKKDTKKEISKNENTI